MWPKSASRRWPGGWASGMNVSWRVAAVRGDVAADLVVAAGVAVLVAQPPEELHGGVPLLGRGVLVVGEDLVDDRGEGPEHGGRGGLVRV